MKAIAYIRVSTKEQGQSGFGREAQRVQIEKFARGAGFKIQHTFSDVHSAAEEDSLSKREGLRDALKYAVEKGWPIIVADFSRLTRRTDHV